MVAAPSLVETSSVAADGYAQAELTKCQTGALIGYGGMYLDLQMSALTDIQLTLTLQQTTNRHLGMCLKLGL